jgi:hypothetical protein
MIATAIYKGEEIQVLDFLICRGKGVMLINYGGPVWVEQSELTQVKFLHRKEA